MVLLLVGMGIGFELLPLRKVPVTRHLRLQYMVHRVSVQATVRLIKVKTVQPYSMMSL